MLRSAMPACVLSALFSLPLSAAATTGAIEITVPETPVLRGDPVDIRIAGLEPGAPVTVIAERTWGRGPARVFRASATFVADGSGIVEQHADEPETAPWQGVDQFGLLWSMTPTEDPVPEGRSSTVIEIGVDADGDGQPDATASFRSIRAHDDLVRTELGDGFPGAFLLRPPGDEPLPAVIVLGGSEGGDSTARNVAPNLASRGFAVLGLPYYSPAYWGRPAQFTDLPRAFHDIPVDRLEAARDWLLTREDIAHDSIGLYGVSKGAEFVLLGSTLIDGFSAVVAIVPSDVVWEAWGPGTVEGESSCWSWRGEPVAFLPYVGMNEEIGKYMTGGTPRIRTPHDAGREANPDRIEAARIRVEDIQAPVMVVGGDKDDVWDSGSMTRNIQATREAAGLETVVIVDEEAGHSLSGDGSTPTRAAEARVQGAAFPAMLEFFREHLRAKPRR